ncbi:MAG: hypothetical protein ACR2NO_01790 [Chloroflexota bacterium]
MTLSFTRHLGRHESVALLTVGVVTTVLMLTYRPEVDGSPTPFFVASLAGAISSGLFLMRGRRVVPTRASYTLLALSALAAPTLLHAVRLANRHAEVSVGLTQPLTYRDLFTPVVDAPASFNPGPHGLELLIPPGSRAFLELNPARPLSGPVPDWALPRALRASLTAAADELRWRGQVVRDRPFLVIVEIEQFSVQAVAGGLLVTSVVGGQPTAMHAALDLDLTLWQDWVLQRTAQQTSLSIGGRVAWVGRSPASFRRVRFGETRADSAHGGALRFQRVQVARFLA